VIAAALSRTRLLATLVALVTFVGLLSWWTMPRQEDPSFAERFATVVVAYPGASAPDVERLVLQPVEDELIGIPELREVIATARPGVGVFRLRLKDTVASTETDAAWDEVRRSLAQAEQELPADALAPSFDNGVGDPASAVYLLTGTPDLLALRDSARRLQDRLERVEGVKRVTLLGDPGRRIRVELDPLVARRVGLQAPVLAQQLRDANVTLPAGSVEVDGRNLVLRSLGELSDVADVRALPVLLPGGSTVPLGSLATVAEAPRFPATTRVLRDQVASVGVNVIPVPEQDLVALGDRLQAAVDGLALPHELHVFQFQPTLVERRIGQLTTSLVTGVLIVAGVLMLLMGPRMGFVVSAIVPLVALASVGVYAVGGGVLHQISIAALVLALGLLVDNAIVMAEAVQQHLDAGHDNPAAAAVHELGIPLGTATGTTVAAFVPMLLSEGGTADFTRTIPLVVILALVLSYVYALVITPNLAAFALRPSTGGPGRGDRIARRIAALAIGWPRTVLVALALAVVGAGFASLAVPAEFFPLSDRDQVVVTMALPEGTHPDTTLETARAFAGAMAEHPAVAHSTAFVGGGLPRFYYNLNDTPNSPHRAVVVLDAPEADLEALMADVRAKRARWPDATLVPSRLQQGPPVGAPIQLRLTSDDAGALADASDAVVRALRAIPGTRDVETTLGTGVPSLELAPRDAWALRRRVGRASIALATLAQTHALPAGTVRLGTDALPVELTSTEGEGTPVERLATVPVATPTGPVPLAMLADAAPRWQPASITRRDGVREVTVSAQLMPGTSFTDVLASYDAADVALPDGVASTTGGEAEGSGEANTALLRTLPLGMGLLVFFLLLEFDSFRRLGIVLTTVPLAAVGVIPGLALSGQPFGFMSLLGLLALVGIVVNNAIVLLNVVERRRDEGASVAEALTDAVRLRMRPILLTTVTTVAGMLPLAFSASALWPPLAWALLSGLIASTVLTLVAVPALYAWLFDRPAGPRRRWALLALVLPATAGAAPMPLDDFLAAAAVSPTVEAVRLDARAQGSLATSAWLDAATPRLTAGGDVRRLEEEIAIDTPIGPFVQQPKQVGTFGVRVTQPLLDAAGWAGARAARQGALAAAAGADRTREAVVRELGLAYLELASLQGDREAVGRQIAALEQVARDARTAVELDLALDSDALRAEVALDEARLATSRLDAAMASLGERLAAAIGASEPVEPVVSGAEGFVGSSRPDLLAAERAVAASEAGRVAQGLALVPRVLLDVGWQTTDNRTLVATSWADGGVRAEWALGGGRFTRVAAASLQRRAAHERLVDLRRSVAVEQAAATREEAVAAEAVAVRRQSVLRVEEAARVLRDRYGAQLVPLTDVLQIEAELTSQQAALTRARLDVVRARLEAAHAGSCASGC
jgi:multidrug efflux pump subunit AcrB